MNNITSKPTATKCRTKKQKQKEGPFTNTVQVQEEEVFAFTAPKELMRKIKLCKQSGKQTT